MFKLNFFPIPDWFGVKTGTFVYIAIPFDIPRIFKFNTGKICTLVYKRTSLLNEGRHTYSLA